MDKLRLTNTTTIFNSNSSISNRINNQTNNRILTITKVMVIWVLLLEQHWPVHRNRWVRTNRGPLRSCCMNTSAEPVRTVRLVTLRTSIHHPFPHCRPTNNNSSSNNNNSSSSKPMLKTYTERLLVISSSSKTDFHHPASTTTITGTIWSYSIRASRDRWVRSVAVTRKSET